jgi:hypothetical protein
VCVYIFPKLETVTFVPSVRVARRVPIRGSSFILKNSIPCETVPAEAPSQQVIPGIPTKISCALA